MKHIMCLAFMLPALAQSIELPPLEDMQVRRLDQLIAIRPTPGSLAYATTGPWCVVMDVESYRSAPTTWVALTTYTRDVIRASSPVTPAMSGLCFDTQSPAADWTVAPLSSGMRPVYAYSGATLGAKLGNIAINSPCGDFVRNSANGMQYRVVILSGQLGAALCQRSAP